MLDKLLRLYLRNMEKAKRPQELVDTADICTELSNAHPSNIDTIAQKAISEIQYHGTQGLDDFHGEPFDYSLRIIKELEKIPGKYHDQAVTIVHNALHSEMKYYQGDHKEINKCEQRLEELQSYIKNH